MHRRLLPHEAIVAIARANEYRVPAGLPAMPVSVVDHGLLTGALGEPFRTSSFGEQYFRTVGEKAAILAYALVRARPFPQLNTLATTVIFTAFLAKNGRFWNIAREDFLPSIEALESWGQKTWDRPGSWLVDLGMMAEWVETHTSPLPGPESGAGG